MAARDSKGRFLKTKSSAAQSDKGGGAKADVKLLGMKRLKRMLKRLGTKGAAKAVRAGVGKAVAVLRKGIRQEVPADAKSIKKAVSSKVKVNKKVGVLAKVGINIGLKKGKGYAPHGAMYVLGTKDRQTESGQSRGSTAGNDVVKRGLAKTEGQATREMGAKMRQVIKQEARKR